MANYRRMNPGLDSWNGDDDDYGDNSSDDMDHVPRLDVVSTDSPISDDELCLAPPTIFGFSMT